SAELETVVWTRLLEGLQQSPLDGVPDRPVPDGSAYRRIQVFDTDLIGEATVTWDETAGLGELRTILDAVVFQVSDGSVNLASSGLPRLVHRRIQDAPVK